jgi:hypothetical protein
MVLEMGMMIGCMVILYGDYGGPLGDGTVTVNSSGIRWGVRLGDATKALPSLKIVLSNDDEYVDISQATLSTGCSLSTHCIENASGTVFVLLCQSRLDHGSCSVLPDPRLAMLQSSLLQRQWHHHPWLQPLSTV